MATAQATPLTGRTAWARNLAAPVRDFLSTETGSAIVLLVATVAALLWANSPWPDSYESVWTTELSIRLGDWALTADLRDWVNDGLMTFFFLVVGLEAKRELDLGELRDRKRLALPVVAGLGGMVVPVADLPGASTPAATGGARLGRRDVDRHRLRARRCWRWPRRAAPRGCASSCSRSRWSTTSCALLVIATVYSEHVSLVGAGRRDRAVRRARRAALRAGRPLGRPRPSSGVADLGRHVQVGHPSDDRRAGDRPGRRARIRRRAATSSAPARASAPSASSRRPSSRAPRSSTWPRRSRPNERLQYRLHPWTSYAIVPLFALANAGITFSGGLLGDALRSPVTLGIVFGYVVGKPAGIVGASWLATRAASRRPAPAGRAGRGSPASARWPASGSPSRC